MWYEGNQEQWHELDDPEVMDWFAANEYLTPDFSNIDDPSILEKSYNDYDIVMDNSKLPWVDIPDINVPYEDIYKEAHHLLHTACYTLHRPCSSGWLSLAIHGISSVHTNCAEDYGLPHDYEETHSNWTDIAKFCPRTVEWMKEEINYKQFGRVRFMALLPGGWIGPHTDRDSIVGLGATNIAISQPDDCVFVMDGMGKVPYKPGSVMKLNTAYKHGVWNRSDDIRIHMIFDGDLSEDFRWKVNKGYQQMLGK